ncbi:hypothetical protein HNQ93_003897 [Hymenobacter luteus]|uniref:Glycosyltransferase RgtA/B/C/D-like domain-containing protein n=2 Tax=Hymenobacter TaxID=89966 RepID=A0A7W9T3P6_9BACT|nr:hypothetical protein [Hymenobacter luteus]MBB6061021.1 hypothetical protein [Hymenobacter luteus]
MPNVFAPARFGRGWWLWPGLPLLVILLIRLGALQAGGALAFPDEERHLKSVEAVEAIFRGDVERLCLHLANTQGRPADALLRLPVALVQVGLHRFWQIPPASPTSLLVPQLLNWVVLLLNMALLWRLARRWLPAATASVVLVVYSALSSTQLYVRHLLPYDTALGVVLLALVLLSAPAAAVRSPWRSGLLAGGLGLLAFAVYPGYYFAPLLPGALLLASLPLAAWKRALLGFGTGAGVVVVPLEVLTRFGHISYLRTLQHLPATVIQGDFSEGFSFLPRYLWQVEGLTGALLLLAALPGLWALLFRYARPVTRVVAAVPIAAWLGHACLGYFAHTLVFYGRIAHFFLPFLALYAGSALQLIRPRRLQQLTAAGLVAAAFWGLARFVPTYFALAYPRDVLAAYPGVAPGRLRYLNEGGLNATLNYAVPPGRPQTGSALPDSLVLVNCTFLYPLLSPDCQPVRLPAAHQPVLDAPHFLTLPAYGFEGFSPAMREQLQRCGFRCRVYKVVKL